MTIDHERLHALAGSQLGLATVTQLRALGLTNRQIAYQVSTKRWIRRSRNVIQLGGSPGGWRQDLLVGCLDGPEDAVSSLLSAAAVHALLEHPPPPQVTVQHGGRTRSTVATIHRARLFPIDCTVVDGIPCTTVERTLVDCARVLGPNRLQKLVDAAAHKHLIRPAGVDRAWDRSQRAPGRAGHAKLLAALEPWRLPITPGSPAELRLLVLLRQWGFPEPELQVPILDESGNVIARADVGWSLPRIGLEYEGVDFHGPERWATDMERHDRTAGAGWQLAYADKADLMPGERGLRDTLIQMFSTERAAKLRRPVLVAAER